MNIEHTRILTNKSSGDSPNFHSTYIYVIVIPAIIGEALLPMKETLKLKALTTAKIKYLNKTVLAGGSL